MQPVADWHGLSMLELEGKGCVKVLVPDSEQYVLANRQWNGVESLNTKAKTTTSNDQCTHTHTHAHAHAHTQTHTTEHINHLLSSTCVFLPCTYFYHFWHWVCVGHVFSLLSAAAYTCQLRSPDLPYA